MRKAAGLLVAVAGVGFGAYAYQNSDGDRHATERLTAMVRIASEGSRPASVIPKAMVVDVQPSPVTAVPVRVGEANDRVVRSPAATDAAPSGSGLSGQAERQVTGDRMRFAERATGQDMPARPLRTSNPADDGSRRELAKSIQSELKRVGCFEGEIDGSWSPASKQAMKRFTDRVNATLPIEQPDYILLTMLQGHSDRACGINCPAGQVMATGGRCLPRAIVTQEERKQAPKAGAPKAAMAVEAEQREASLARKAELTDAQIVRERAIEAARLKEQKALEDRQARLAAERAAQERAAEVAAVEARRARELAAEQRKVQEQARLEAERQARARAVEEQRAKAELAAEDARRKQQQAAEQRQLAERRKADEQARAAEEHRAKAVLAAEEARRRQQLAVEQQQLAERRRAEEVQRIEAERLALVAAAKEKQRLAALVEPEMVRKSEVAPSAATTVLNAPAPGAKSSVPVEAQTAAGTAADASGERPGTKTVAEARPEAVDVRAASGESSVVAPKTEQPTVKKAPVAKARGEQAQRRNEAVRDPARREPRFVQRFIPPPYYIGRVSQGPQPVFRPAPVYIQRRPTPSLGSRIYHDLSRNAP